MRRSLYEPENSSTNEYSTSSPLRQGSPLRSVDKRLGLSEADRRGTNEGRSSRCEGTSITVGADLPLPRRIHTDIVHSRTDPGGWHPCLSPTTSRSPAPSLPESNAEHGQSDLIPVAAADTAASRWSFPCCVTLERSRRARRQTRNSAEWRVRTPVRHGERSPAGRRSGVRNGRQTAARASTAT